jgi:opacity protein-like surface antigen
MALDYKTVDFGDIPITTTDNPDGTGQSYSPSYLIVGLTYSKVRTDRVSAGTSFKYIHEGIMNTSADGWALDFGVQYRFKSNLAIGASVKNIGGNMQYAGEDLKVKTDVPGSALSSGSGVYEADTEPFQIPSYFELSASYISQFNEQNNLELASFFRNNNNLEDLMGFGMEYSFMQTFFLRGGYNFLLENTSDYIYDFTAGAGVNYKMAGGVNLIFDYATLYSASHNDFKKTSDLRVSDADYNKFLEFLKDKSYDYTTSSDDQLDELIKIARQEKYYEGAESEFEALKHKLAHDKEKDLQTFKEEIKLLLYEEIASRYFYQKGRIQASLEEDPELARAVEVLNNPQLYASVLKSSFTAATVKSGMRGSLY